MSARNKKKHLAKEHTNPSSGNRSETASSHGTRPHSNLESRVHSNEAIAGAVGLEALTETTEFGEFKKPSDTKATKAIREQREYENMVDLYNKRRQLLPLDFELLNSGLSDIGIAPKKLSNVYHKLSLPNRGIKSILGISALKNLYTLELQGNQIEDVSPIANLRYLVQIDLSSNNLTTGIQFDETPFNLQYLELSRNMIQDIGDMSCHRFLNRICLDSKSQNILSSRQSSARRFWSFWMSQLERPERLKQPNLINRALEKFTSKNAKHSEFYKLILQSGNQIEEISCVETLSRLTDLAACDNKISDLTPLKNHPCLNILDLLRNKVESLENIALLSTVKNLRNLNIDENPVNDLPNSTWIPEIHENIPFHQTADYHPTFRLKTVFMVPRLSVLNGLPVPIEEKVSAINMYNPPTDVMISLQHAHQQKLGAKAYARIKAEDLMRAKRLRPVVLCGPNGAGKRTLTARLLQEFPHIYGHCISHTTRSPRPGEEHGVHYWFVSKKEMQRMNQEGQFLTIVTLFGNMYGTSMDSIDRVTEEGKICILDLELEVKNLISKQGAIALRKSHLRPRYILVTPSDVSVLEQRINNRNKGALLPMDIEQWIKKAQEGIEGDFDFTVVNDNLEHAYSQLREYCLSEYWKDFDEEDV